MNTGANLLVSDENPLDLDQPSEQSRPGTHNVEREGRDDSPLRRADATRRRRRAVQNLQNVIIEWKDAARPEYRPFAEALRAALRRKGMSASDVAREIWGSTTDRRGYSVAKNRDRIGLYLNATAYPDEESLKELARVLDVTMEELTVKQVRTAVNAVAPGANLFIQSYARASRPSGPSLTPVPGRPGMVRMQVDQFVNWRLALKLFEELQEAAEAEAEMQLFTEVETKTEAKAAAATDDSSEVA